MVKGVLLSYDISLPSNRNDSKLTFMGSGINFGERWVLTHGNLFSNLKVTRDILKRQAHSPHFKSDKLYKEFPDVYVQLEDASDPANFLNNIVSKKGKVVYLWKSKLLKHAIDNIMANWTIGYKYGNIDEQIEGKYYFPVLVLIEITDNKSSDVNVKDILSNLYDMTIKHAPIRGEELLMESTPFGNEIFINSTTKGVICNVFGLDNCIALCDASSTICCEGGPVFKSDDKSFFGMIVNSLSWCRGEWVGLTIVVFLAPILHNHLFQNQNDQSLKLYMSPKRLILSNLLDNLDSTVIQVKCGSSWGSGIALGNGYVLTCAHVVQNYKDIILNCKGHLAKADVVLKSSDYNAYDLALLYTHSKEIALNPVKFAKRPAIKGEVVVAVGYPYFDKTVMKDYKPTVARGVVNNVNPYGLQTSCCVQSGSSGGAIMRLSKEIGSEVMTYELLGVIVCNTKDNNNDASFPNVNMAIPSHIVRKPLEDFINKKNSSLPEFEGDTDKVVRSFWNFRLAKAQL